jgi:hypothetical protein
VAKVTFPPTVCYIKAPGFPSPPRLKKLNGKLPIAQVAVKLRYYDHVLSTFGMANDVTCGSGFG